MQATPETYKTVLRWPALTRFYDAVIALTMREQTFRGAVIDLLQQKAPTRVLDVGCGTGSLTVLIHQALPKSTVVGIDGDEEVVRLARLKVGRSLNSLLRFQTGRATALPSAPDSWDAVTCSLVLHHLPDADKQRSLGEMYRVLKPGGVVIIADWDRPANSFMSGLFFLLQAFDGFDTTAAHRRGELPALIQQSGFQGVCRTRQFNVAFGTLGIYQAEKPI